jgi:hypothetical protein
MGAADSYIDDESASGVYTLQGWAQFQGDCHKFREDFSKYLTTLPGRICGLGAPAKATVLINYCQIDSRLVEYIVDDTKEKAGHYIPGSDIPVCNRECASRRKKAEHAVIFAWNWASEIKRKFPGYNYIIPRVKRVTSEDYVSV